MSWVRAVCCLLTCANGVRALQRTAAERSDGAVTARSSSRLSPEALLLTVSLTLSLADVIASPVFSSVDSVFSLTRR